MLNNRELATVVAALKFWVDGAELRRGPSDQYASIASGFGLYECVPLTRPETEVLTENLERVMERRGA